MILLVSSVFLKNMRGEEEEGGREIFDTQTLSE